MCRLGGSLISLVSGGALVSLGAFSTACGSSARTGEAADAAEGMDATQPPAKSDGGVEASLAEDASGDQGPWPLGATLGPGELHFRVRADAAVRVEVDLYTQATGVDESIAVVMTRAAAGQPWVADIPYATLVAHDLAAPYLYGYRAWGPNWPYDPSWMKGSNAGFVSDVDSMGDRFDPNKLIFDPYSREASHDPLEPSQQSTAPYLTGSVNRDTDDGRLAPKSIAFVADSASIGMTPARALKDDVIYEVHLRGLTMNDPSVEASLQGTYAGAATKATYLAALGVTAIELLPIHETQNDTNDDAGANANYWGYSTLAFFAPDRRYASDRSFGGPTREFRAMVAAFHDAGLKVFLDVVFNHTAEGGAIDGSNPSIAEILSFRGLDNAAYYELAANNETPVDDTGTGGNFNAGEGVVRDLVIDSLQYWAGVMGIDGFRFDLAAVLGNSCTSACFTYSPDDPNGILARAVAGLPGTSLIAEPWGVGNGTYELGNFPAGWSEWNGAFRDEIREAQNELGVIAIAPSTLAARIEGSPDIFAYDGGAPSGSINFVDCHDGFTMRDEYAYDAPENAQPYPLGPSSGGSTTDYPWDQGGDAGAQARAARTALGLVATSAGVPMIQGGDEMLRTQYGNNNAYNLDDSAMWLDWSLAGTNASFVAWTSATLAFRAAHTALRPAHFWTGTDTNGNGLPDIAFYDNTGAVASAAYLGNTANHFIAWRVDGSQGIPPDAARSIYIAWNGWTGDIAATLPSPASTSTAWYLSGDSAAGVFASPGQETALGGTSLTVSARSIVLVIER